jgi:hypothetical protein
MRRLAPRLIFLALLGGGLLLWSQFRKPRDLRLQIDLTEVRPGEVTDVDVVVRRGNRALARHEVRYDGAGAPATVELIVHARPGPAEVETTLGYAGKPARRIVARVDLSDAGTARVRAE